MPQKNSGTDMPRNVTTEMPWSSVVLWRIAATVPRPTPAIATSARDPAASPAELAGAVASTRPVGRSPGAGRARLVAHHAGVPARPAYCTVTLRRSSHIIGLDWKPFTFLR